MAQRRKIYITGGGGSGKTTLARRLAGATGIPCFELDAILWTDSKTGERVPSSERQRLIGEIASRPSWIADGVYVGWAQEIWNTADLIIYLDPPLKLMLWRIFWRHLKAEIARNNRHPGWRKLFRFMKFVAQSHRSPETGDIDDDRDEILTRAKINAKVNQHRDKALVIERKVDIDEILAIIGHK
ncbi:MAG: hypothetical protein O3B95_13020 [Chloroflexi bacterium]|nr:hypothetical protein [Chloroflexota bacterium]